MAEKAENLASALLTRLVLQALAARGDPALLPPDLGRLPDPLRQAHVDAGLKRRLLEHALAVGGPDILVAVGRSICQQGFAPPLAVWLRAGSVAILAQQWMRFERYFHSSNRTKLDMTGDGMAATRWMLGGGRPTRAENLLIQGLLQGLLERYGCRDVVLLSGADDAQWRYRWQGVTRQIPPIEAAPAMAQPPLPVGPMARRLARHLAEEPARLWRLEEAAGLLKLSPRQLQRDLAAEGTSFQGLLRGLRIREACGRLIEGDWSLAEIGYACGFADQAHFQRQFREATNVTPGDYRALEQLNRR